MMVLLYINFSSTNHQSTTILSVRIKKRAKISGRGHLGNFMGLASGLIWSEYL